MAFRQADLRTQRAQKSNLREVTLGIDRRDDEEPRWPRPRRSANRWTRFTADRQRRPSSRLSQHSHVLPTAGRVTTKLRQAETIAERLGYPWRFVPTGVGFMRRYFGSDQHAAYIAFADTAAVGTLRAGLAADPKPERRRLNPARRRVVQRQQRRLSSVVPISCRKSHGSKLGIYPIASAHRSASSARWSTSISRCGASLQTAGKPIPY